MQNINAKIQDVLKRHKIKKQYLFVLFLLSVMVITAVCFSLMSPAISMSGDRVCMKAEHLHNSNCYAPKLVCTENTEGHSHSDDCFTTETQLVCGLEEDENHSHSEECYKDEEVLICEIPENEGHVHTDECYTNELICVEEEHIHSADCYNLAGKTAADDTDNIDDDEVFLGEETATLPDNLIQSVAINDDEEYDPDKGLNFEKYIIDVDFKPEIKTDNGSLSNEKTDYYNQYDQVTGISYDVKYGKLTIDYQIDPGKLDSNTKTKIYYQLPDNIYLDKDLTGHTYKGDTEIGTYEITKNGLITIDFYSWFLANASQNVDGKIEFRAKVRRDGNNVSINNKNLDVPFSDLKVEKSVGDVNREDKTVPYTITVSSKSGCKGPIKIEDVFSSETDSTHYASAVKCWTDGQQVTITKSDGSSFSKYVQLQNGIATIDGLDGLNPGESYQITYNATIDTTVIDDKDKNIVMNNTVTASNGSLKPQASANKTVSVSAKILSKDAEYISNETPKKIKWTVKLENPWGDSLKDYAVYDDMFKSVTNLNINGISIDSATNIGSFDKDSGRFTFGENANDLNYTFTYTTEVTDIDIENGSIKNIVDLYKKEIKIDTKDKTVKFEKFEIKKTGTADITNDKVRWTISVINPDKLSLNGYQIIDEMFKVGENFKIGNDSNIDECIRDDGDLGGWGFGTLKNDTFTVNIWADKWAVDDKTIEISFDVPITSEMKIAKEAVNNVSIKNNENKVIDTDQCEVPLNYENTNTKTRLDPVEEDKTNTKHIVQWESIFNAGASFDAKTYTDILTCDTWSDGSINYHYMTMDQLKDLKVTGSLLNSENYDQKLTFSTDYTIIASYKNLNESNSQWETIKIPINNNEDFSKISDKCIIEYIIIFNQDSRKEYFQNLDNVKINYSSVCNIDGVSFGQSRYYYNKGYFDNLTEQNAQYQYSLAAPFIKGNCTDGGYHENGMTYDYDKYLANGQLQIKWYIEIKEGSYNSDQNIELKDKLPLGTTLSKDPIIYKILNSNEWEDVNSNNIGMSINGNEITFNIPGNIHQGKQFRIEYANNVPDSSMDMNNPWNDKTNQVTDNIYNYTTQNTQKIYKQSDKLISKQLSYDETKCNEVTYTLDVNPHGDKISNTDNSGQIIIKDEIQCTQKDRFESTLKKLTVYSYNQSGELEIVAPTRYVLEIDDTNKTFTLTLPDNEHFKVEYQYNWVYTQDAYTTNNPNVSTADDGTKTDWGIDINNTANLYKTDSDQAVNNDSAGEKRFKLDNDSLSIAGTGVDIEKIDSANAAIKIEGAEFALLRFKNNQWEVLEQPAPQGKNYNDAKWLKADNESNPANGYVLTSNSEGKVKLTYLEKNMLYKVVETKAPSGYAKSSKEYLFAYDEKPSIYPSGIQENNVTLFLKGGIIRIENQRMLPATGGVGTSPYIITGIVIMAGSAVMYLILKRHRRRIK